MRTVPACPPAAGSWDLFSESGTRPATAEKVTAPEKDVGRHRQGSRLWVRLRAVDIVIGLCHPRPMGGSDPHLVISGSDAASSRDAMARFPTGQSVPLAAVPSAFGALGADNPIPAARRQNVFLLVERRRDDVPSGRRRGWSRVIHDLGTGPGKSRKIELRVGRMPGQREDPSLPRSHGSWGEGSRFILTKAKQAGIAARAGGLARH